MKADLVQYLGSDLVVVNAARVSFDKESEWDIVDWKIDPNPDLRSYNPVYALKDKDVKLINYLAKHNHWTPFSHCQITMRETVPLFVARQRFKHMVGFTYNEVSRRYVNDAPEFFYPDEWRTKPVGSIKQGSGTEKLPEPDFIEGFCKNCGTETSPVIRTQGGGRSRIYCSEVCKYSYINKNRNPYKNIWNNAKARANRENKEWSIDFDTFDFPSHCPLLKFELDYSVGKGSIQNNSPSFDRIDPKKDYVEGNVRIISNQANTMKSNANTEELIEFAKSILLQHKGIIVDESLSYEVLIDKAKKLYNTMIKEGYAAEQARMVLPQSMYTSYYVTGSLAAWARAYKLRSDPHSQLEIQELAKQWWEILSNLYPISWKALTE